jgi:GH25 family lysozyme M1 (1,4-beta-N-acetylmuramidase)
MSEMPNVKGVDVSTWNGDVDFQSLADNGIQFVVVRIGYGQQGSDDKFIDNVNGAHNAGLKVGGYYYSCAKNTTDAVYEAKNCKSIVNNSGLLLELPIFYDLEDKAIPTQYVTDIARAFLAEMQPLTCGVYASYDWLTNYIDYKNLNCPIWNAEWGDVDDIQGYMWQYTDNFVINGKTFDGDYLNEEV